jgi:cell division protein FtsL
MDQVKDRQQDKPATSGPSQQWQYAAVRGGAKSESIAATAAASAARSDQGAYSFWSISAKWMIAVWLGVLLSAFLVVYSKDLSRRLFIQYSSLRQQSHIKQVDWGRLLLENATLSTPARVQRIARTQLGMVMPTEKDMVMVVPPAAEDLSATATKNIVPAASDAAANNTVVTMPKNTQWVAANKEIK